jgi:hypothetical protein
MRSDRLTTRLVSTVVAMLFMGAPSVATGDCRS